VGRRAGWVQRVKGVCRQRYAGSAGGGLWGLVLPRGMLTSWTFVFQYCMKSEMPPGALTSNYTIFLLCGYLPWMLFQETVTRSANSLLEDSNLITKTLFLSEMLPISVFFSSLANHLLALALSLVAVAYFEGGISPYALLLPLYMALIGLLGVGIGWGFASLQVFGRGPAEAPVPAGREGVGARGRARCQARRCGDAVHERRRQGARVRVSQHRVRAAPAIRQPRQLLRAGGTAEILEHVSAPGRRQCSSA